MNPIVFFCLIGAAVAVPSSGVPVVERVGTDVHNPVNEVPVVRAVPEAYRARGFDYPFYPYVTDAEFRPFHHHFESSKHFPEYDRYKHPFYFFQTGHQYYPYPTGQHYFPYPTGQEYYGNPTGYHRGYHRGYHYGYRHPFKASPF